MQILPSTKPKTHTRQELADFQIANCWRPSKGLFKDPRLITIKTREELEMYKDHNVVAVFFDGAKGFLGRRVWRKKSVEKGTFITINAGGTLVFSYYKKNIGYVRSLNKFFEQSTHIIQILLGPAETIC